jgi:peptidyl-tRNA hydrolase
LRIGVGRPKISPDPSLTRGEKNIADYVLSNFSKEEIPIFQADVMTQSLLMIEKWIHEEK